MPPAPLVSTATSQPVPAHYVHTVAGHFADSAGRVLLFRGINLSSGKTPVDRPTHRLDWETAESSTESYVGRPLDLDDGSADVHLARLRGWGLNCIRFAFTWEAIEHEGPGKYDHEYINYTVRVLRRCKDYGFRVYMNPHQDVWSRFSGGSGAPCWTLIACGLNPRHFTATEAAVLHFEHPDPASYPAMLWGTNNERFVCQLVFTLFFAGRDFAPRCIIDRVNIQDWLQKHFIDACGVLADAIRDAGDLYDVCVIGWDSINEPSAGLVGTPDLANHPSDQSMKQEAHPTPAQAIRLANGIPQKVKAYVIGALGPRRSGSRTVDPKGQTVWSSPETEDDVGDGSGDRVNRRWGWRRAASWPLGQCIWALHGVWSPDPESKSKGTILRADYFETCPSDPSRSVNFVEDYWRPHWRAYSKRIRQAHPEAIFFIQPPVFAPPPDLNEDDLKGRAAYSAHFYDALSVLTRKWNFFNADALGLVRNKHTSVLGSLRIGTGSVRKVMRDQMGTLKGDAHTILDAYPTIIGETGVPFNMYSKQSYKTGDYTSQTKALDSSLNGADGTNVVNWTMWNYTPDHTHEWGDGWNLEDFSIWSQDDIKFGRNNSPAYTIASSSFSSERTVQVSADQAYNFFTSSARAVGAFSRPWPIATVGAPTFIEFDIDSALFEMRVQVAWEDRVATEAGLMTEVYVPLVHYASGSVLEVRSNEAEGQTELSQGEVNSSELLSPKLASSDSTPGFALDTQGAVGTLVRSDMFVIEVEISEGQWSLDGQVLKWKYDVPEEGEKAKQLILNLRRIGGPIKGITSESDGVNNAEGKSKGGCVIC